MYYNIIIIMMRGRVDSRLPGRYKYDVRVVHADGLRRSLVKFQIFPRGPGVYVIYIYIYTKVI